MKKAYLFFLLIIITYTAGCGYLSKSRRMIYIKNHPELSMEQKNLLIKGKLWVGMTPKEARVSLGGPYIIQKDILGEKEIWSYMYKDISTTHTDYKFNRALKLEFIEGRLANWRED